MIISPSMITEPKGKKRSSVRHTHAIQRARTQRPLSAPPAEAVVARLTEIVHPATLAQVSYFHHLGLRARLLTLPVMVALAEDWGTFTYRSRHRAKATL